jgi:hypothetical protein
VKARGGYIYLDDLCDWEKIHSVVEFSEIVVVLEIYNLEFSFFSFETSKEIYVLKTKFLRLIIFNFTAVN